MKQTKPRNHSYQGSQSFVEDWLNNASQVSPKRKGLCLQQVVRLSRSQQGEDGEHVLRTPSDLSPISCHSFHLPTLNLMPFTLHLLSLSIPTLVDISSVSLILCSPLLYISYIYR